jgi:hypothetical protein
MARLALPSSEFDLNIRKAGCVIRIVPRRKVVNQMANAEPTSDSDDRTRVMTSSIEAMVIRGHIEAL